MANSGEAVMVQSEKFFSRLRRVFLPPRQVLKMDMAVIDLQNRELLDRVEALKQATIDGEEKWFLCLTKDQKVCYGRENDEK
jgi:hypothetical protein